LKNSLSVCRYEKLSFFIWVKVGSLEQLFRLFFGCQLIELNMACVGKKIYDDSLQTKEDLGSGKANKIRAHDARHENSLIRAKSLNSK
jgi:hypothetical protein